MEKVPFTNEDNWENEEAELSEEELEEEVPLFSSSSEEDEKNDDFSTNTLNIEGVDINLIREEDKSISQSTRVRRSQTPAFERKTTTKADGTVKRQSMSSLFADIEEYVRKH